MRLEEEQDEKRMKKVKMDFDAWLGEAMKRKSLRLLAEDAGEAMRPRMRRKRLVCAWTSVWV